MAQTTMTRDAKGSVPDHHERVAPAIPRHPQFPVHVHVVEPSLAERRERHGRLHRRRKVKRRRGEPELHPRLVRHLDDAVHHERVAVGEDHLVAQGPGVDVYALVRLGDRRPAGTARELLQQKQRLVLAGPRQPPVRGENRRARVGPPPAVYPRRDERVHGGLHLGPVLGGVAHPPPLLASQPQHLLLGLFRVRSPPKGVEQPRSAAHPGSGSRRDAGSRAGVNHRARPGGDR
mmetsp:Transcript_1095/g.4173  ORF Transcript_1095/g.4173 Transcript_1095/m.4173 type:complete len:233 (+) Transcript_1095:1954-2652(+)